MLCSPGRLDRPWQGQTEAVRTDELPAYDPDCALCPGNRRAQGERNPAYTGTFAFNNDFPALSPTVEAAVPAREVLLRSQPESGALPRPLLLAAPRPHAGGDEQRRDPGRGRRLGG